MGLGNGIKGRVVEMGWKEMRIHTHDHLQKYKSQPQSNPYYPTIFNPFPTYIQHHPFYINLHQLQTHPQLIQPIHQLKKQS